MSKFNLFEDSDDPQSLQTGDFDDDQINSDASDAPFEEIIDDAVMVEPVSRAEAEKIGVDIHPRQPGGKADGTSIINNGNSTASADPMEVMADIRQMLRQGKVDLALPLAQELVWQHPELTAAKVLIARCFQAKREYPKAIAILQSIVSTTEDDDAYYFLAVCQKDSGKRKEAGQTIERALKIAKDTSIRRRAQDLSLAIKGEPVQCEECGREFTPDVLTEIDGQLVCTECAESLAIDDEVTRQTKRRSHYRRRLVYQRLKSIAVFIVFIGILGWVGYTNRYYIKEIFRIADSKPPTPLTSPEPPARKGTFDLSSPIISKAIVGLELEHNAHAEGLEKGDDYFVQINPKPVGLFSIEADSGLFRWKPAPEDAGKTYTVTFHVESAKKLSRPQINKIYVSPGPMFRSAGQAWKDAAPGKANFMMAADLSGSGIDDLVLATGDYWQGSLSIFTPGKDGLFAQRARTEFSGRPVGLGIIKAGGEPWLALADYWSGRIRFFSIRKGELGEMADSIDLPGRPLLAAFNAENFLFATLCHTPQGKLVVVLSRLNDLKQEKLGEWPVPGIHNWLSLFIMDIVPNTADKNKAPEVTLALISGDPDASLFLLESQTGEWRNGDREKPKTAIQKAVRTPEGLAFDCDDGKYSSFVEWKDGRWSPRQEMIQRIEPLAFVCQDIDSDGNPDLLSLGRSDLCLLAHSIEGKRLLTTTWQLPAGPPPLGPITTVRDEKGSMVVYPDRAGNLWSLKFIFN